MSSFLDGPRLVVASASADKVIEMRAILSAALGGEVELVARPAEMGEVEETGESLEDNARLKAEAVRRFSGLPSVADDTGLEVWALGGAPGVYSARYAGKDATYAENVAKLLGALSGEADRRAVFRTVVVLQNAAGAELVAEGSVSGFIATEPRGSGGFGYDAVFVPDGGDGRSYAELSLEEKNALSHRSRALGALAAKLLQN